MKSSAAVKQHSVTRPTLIKADPGRPALKVLGATEIMIMAGTIFADHRFDTDASIALPDGGLEPGSDYAVVVDAGAARAVKLAAIPSGDDIMGGFHFAPGGNAPARAGGDDKPAINPASCWDLNFRFAGADPRGMFLEMLGGNPFWCDIYLLGRYHLKDGTSRFGVTIADGDDPPQKLDGSGYFRKLDYKTAVAVMAHHGKTLLSYDEYRVCGYGVTERTSCGSDPNLTGLDAPRTSRGGGMQMSGNLWIWGHDGDPDLPRASLFGGSWLFDDDAGARLAGVARDWPGNSGGGLGARGRGGHLQLD